MTELGSHAAPAVNRALDALERTYPELGRRPFPRQGCNLPRLLDTMAARGLDGILSYYSPNVCYLSGYATGSSAMVHEANGYSAVILSRHQPEHPIVVIPDFEINYFARQPTWIEDVRPYASLMLPLDVEAKPESLDRFIAAGSRDLDWVRSARGRYADGLVAACVQAVLDLGLAGARVGFDNLTFAPVVAAALPAMEVADAYGALKFTRQVKTPPEMEILREGVALNQTALQRTVAEWRPGMSWHELNIAYYTNAIRLGGFIHDRGSLIIANDLGQEPTILISSGLEDDFELPRGINLMFDCHGTWRRYTWDGGKTWIVDDEPSGDQRTLAQATATVMDDLMDALRPGVGVLELVKRGRQTLRRTGLPEADETLLFFHGVGLENSERETTGRIDWTLEEGMAISLHVLVPGGDRRRWYLEEIAAVTPDGGDRFYTWGTSPLLNE
jgi:Xaa-Pro dipeptidase